jgi:SAM-dependent methyltransferase
MSKKSMVQNYFAQLYEDTMSRVYHDARKRIADCLSTGGLCLDCGAGAGHQFNFINGFTKLPKENYFGIEWNRQDVLSAKQQGLQIDHGDLNANLPFDDNSFQCVFGLSVLERLVNGCHFLKEAHRILKPEGRLVLVTPNLSAWFNILLLLIGRMPSSGPHPDSEMLRRKNNLIQSIKKAQLDLDGDKPSDRHMVVFTYRTLKDYLGMLGFQKITALTYGYYPFPKILQRFLEKLDPWHCHQLLFDCER